MKLEIERKFRVRSDGWRGLSTRTIRIRQGYIAHGPHLVVRVRLTDQDARLTVKTGASGVTRQELEFEMAHAEAAFLIDHHAEGQVIEKTRHLVPVAGLVWEIDVFEGSNQGLVIAEVELEAEEQPFEHPSWLGIEVTGDPRFYNSALARHPFRNWPGHGGLGVLE